MKHKIETLWRTCFNDTEEFIKLYFTHRYSNDITTIIETEEQIIASLQMIPYPMTFGNNIIPTSYISGACTHPEFRNRGVMNQLLRKSIREMWKKGDLMTTLIPADKWLFDYYGKSGYVTTFFYSTSFIYPEDIKQENNYGIEKVNDHNLIIAYHYFNRKMSVRPYCIQHTPEDFNIILQDIHLSGGKILIIKNDNEEVKGILFCVPDEEKIIIKEIITEAGNYQKELLAETLKIFGNKPIEIIQPPEKKEKKELGMSRLVNVPRILDIYVKEYSQISLRFKLSDPIIEENNGYYHLENGIVNRSDEPIKDNYREITISQLTEFVLMGKGQLNNKEVSATPAQFPYMSLMLN